MIVYIVQCTLQGGSEKEELYQVRSVAFFLNIKIFFIDTFDKYQKIDIYIICITFYMRLLSIGTNFWLFRF